MVKFGSQVTVPNTVVRLVHYDEDRTSLLIVNDDAGKVFIGTDREVSAANGLPLASSGGSISINDFFGSDPRLEYFGIVSAGTSDVRILASKSAVFALMIRVLRKFGMVK